MLPLLHVAITTHPKRTDFIPPLLRQLDAGDNVSVFTDLWGDGQWANMQVSLRTASRRASYVLSMQDDVWPCDNFLAGVTVATQALTVYKTAPWLACFYYSTNLVQKALDRGHSWARVDGHFSGLALVIPSDLVEQMISWINARWSGEIRHKGDSRLATYCVAHAMPVYVSAPSLVEHTGTESLVGFRWANAGVPRVAYKYIGAHGDALSIDWTRGLARGVKLAHRPFSLAQIVNANVPYLQPWYVREVLENG
jgi:hypothetical protein